ncbi:MGMT family protein [Bacteroidia bacterium]|nr:MGMT family protein [Bacteroidia bacterium]
MMPKNDTFFDLVCQVVRLIPEGRVTSYGAIGKYLGSVKSARMVGWALNKTHQIHPEVPAHRVVNRNGLLTGKYHFSIENPMAQRLKMEGIPIANNQVIDLDVYFWDPSIHLNLES